MTTLPEDWDVIPSARMVAQTICNPLPACGVQTYMQTNIHVYKIKINHFLKCLMCRYEDLGLNSQHPCKNLGVAMCMPVMPVLQGEVETEGFVALLAAVLVPGPARDLS